MDYNFFTVSWVVWLIVCFSLLFAVFILTPDKLGIVNAYDKIDFFSGSNKTERILTYAVTVLIFVYLTIAILFNLS